MLIHRNLFRKARGELQAKSAIPDPAQYIDQSYLKDALKELSGK